MVQEKKKKPVLKLVTFGQEEEVEVQSLKSIINIMTGASRPMVAKP